MVFNIESLINFQVSFTADWLLSVEKIVYNLPFKIKKVFSKNRLLNFVVIAAHSGVLFMACKTCAVRRSRAG